MKQYDVVIAGGAMAGATLAIALDTLGGGRLKIAVVEAVEPCLDQHPGYDARSIALSLGSSELLASIGCWQALSDMATPISDIHVSDRGHAGMLHIGAREQAVNALGYVIELADAGKLFHRQLAERESIDLLCPETIEAIERDLEGNILTLASGKRLACSLVVAADGAVSGCCEMLGIGRDEYDFQQIAVIANVTTAEHHQGRAFERFTPDGPVALLPMSEGRCSLVWCIRPESQAEIMGLDDEAFLARLQQAFGWRLGRMQKAGRRDAYPLLLRCSQRLVSHRAAVVGNAAQTLHPIAGQGFNLGLRDVMSLAEEILRGTAEGLDAGHQRILSRYRQRRTPDRDATVMMTAGLVGIFANESLPFVVGRNVGLAAMGWSDVCKAPLVRRAMGQVER
ncbi:2-octaprenyl-6-methoxyphenyl hydroxylase [Photobacterium aquae]|uniref:2-octaprenyl-6-methoxyphenyl hydroxylase n=1 Tax=Photobacterium aquae TaxID=1195763 RepID=UPI000ACEDF3B|nr:2-octaprenyl-6-methoxyphenyl hydroxylase [Photobacterium aquae]